MNPSNKQATKSNLNNCFTLFLEREREMIFLLLHHPPLNRKTQNNKLNLTYQQKQIKKNTKTTKQNDDEDLISRWFQSKVREKDLFVILLALGRSSKTTNK